MMNTNQERRKHINNLQTLAARLCKHFTIDPECFSATSRLRRRSGPNNASAIYLWLHDHYGSEDNWGEPIDFDACTKMLREELVKQIPDHHIGEILM